MKEEKETLSELKEARRENIDAGMAEINYTRRLWEELQSYVDESGRVIENKSRVKMITDEINKVLPGSIKWVDDERIAYEKGAEAINQMIAMKRAKIVLDAMEPEYREAILNIREKEVQRRNCNTESNRGWRKFSGCRRSRQNRLALFVWLKSTHSSGK